MEDKQGTCLDKESLFQEQKHWEAVSSLDANSLPVCEFKSNFVGKKFLKHEKDYKVLLTILTLQRKELHSWQEISERTTRKRQLSITNEVSKGLSRYSVWQILRRDSYFSSIVLETDLILSRVSSKGLFMAAPLTVTSSMQSCPEANGVSTTSDENVLL